MLRHLNKLQMDPEPSIRANTTVLLGNIAELLGDATCKKARAAGVRHWQHARRTAQHAPRMLPAWGAARARTGRGGDVHAHGRAHVNARPPAACA